MVTLREAAQQALEVMGVIGADLVCDAAHHEPKDRHGIGDPCPIQSRWHQAFRALRAALESDDTEMLLRQHRFENQQLRAALKEPAEPVAYADRGCVKFIRWVSIPPDMAPLYTAPTPRKPLTDDELLRLWAGDSPRPIMGKNKVLTFARAIEEAVWKKNS